MKALEKIEKMITNKVQKLKYLFQLNSPHVKCRV